MGHTLYLNCDRGISGDMVVAALIDCGVSVDGLTSALASLGISGFDVRVTHKVVGALAACDFDVVLDATHDGHDHDMAYLYGDLDGAGSDHTHCHHHQHTHGDGSHHVHGEHDADHAHDDGSHGHSHGHTHDHGSSGHHHTHEHRTLADVYAIIDAGDLTPRARATARRIFEIVARSEATAHGTTVSKVHFHEVGAVDSIVDIVAAAYCLDALDVTAAVISPLGEGHGRVRSAHGVLSVPVPAVTNIVTAHGLVLAPRNVAGELVTPTGAAIAAAIRTDDALPAAYKIIATGTGAGKRAYDPPSIVRALLVDAVDAGGAGMSDTLGAPNLWKLECEVDDCTGEALAAAVARLYANGAREAHFLPVFMKKGRPGYQLEVLCDEGNIATLEHILFEDTTTIGVRRTPQWRTALRREAVRVTCAYGEVQAKAVTLPDGSRRVYPEHEDVAALAAKHSLTYQDAWRIVLTACHEEPPMAARTQDRM